MPVLSLLVVVVEPRLLQPGAAVVVALWRPLLDKVGLMSPWKKEVVAELVAELVAEPLQALS